MTTTERCPPPDWGEPQIGDSRERSRVALAERVDYLMASASVVGGAELTAQDAARLLWLCRELELSEHETEQVLSAARRSDVTMRHVDEPRSLQDETA